MNKVFQIAFEINGKLSSAFSSSMTQSKLKLTQLGDTAKYISSEQKRLNKLFDSGGIAAGEYTKAMQRMNQEMASVHARQKSLSAAMSKSQQSRQQFSAAAGGLMTTGATVAAASLPFVGIMKTAAEFEATMSKVKAITKADNEEMQTLTNTARTLGEKTQFSARQSAEAMTYLGMAGWKTNQIIAGIPGLLNLAAAGGTDLARTADIVSDDLTAFGLSAEHSTHMADVFAVTITNTNTNVEMLGETMKYAAPVAHAFGASMEETSALAGLMANSGIKATQAGTALRAGFLRLAGPPKMASKAMKALGMDMSDITKQQEEAKAALNSLGIEMENTDGPRKMSSIIKELAEKTADMGNEQKLATMKAIFGQEAATGWIAVLEQGPETLDKLTDELEHSDGAAAKMAKTMNDNAQGAMIRFKSAMESAAISIGNTFLPAMADMGDQMAGYAGNLSQLASEHPEFVSWTLKSAVAIAGLTLAYKAGKTALAGYRVVKSAVLFLIDAENRATLANTAAKVKNGIVTGALKIKTLASAAATKAAVIAQWAFNAAVSANPVGLLIMGLAALIGIGYLVYENFDKVKQLCTAMWESPAAAAIAFATGPIGWVIYAATGLIANWDTVKQWFITLWNDPQAAIDQFCNYLTSRFNEAINWLGEKWKWIKSVFSSPIKANVQASAAAAGQAQVYHNAAGGIYNKGAFLTTFAEDSDEAAIPLNGSRRAVSLWQKAGEILGVNNKGGDTYQFTYSPTITGSDPATIREADRQQNNFFEKIKEFSHQQRRVSYGS